MEDVRALLNPDCFDHPVEHLQVLETNISWIILTGPFAYKIKKPVDFGFLDYSTLEKRRHFCQEELRLNRRLAGKLYLEVVPLGPGPRFGAEPAWEYAVKMREFSQHRLLDGLATRGELRAHHIDSIAAQLARFHLALPGARPGSRWGSPSAVHAPVQENFQQLKPYADLADLEAWSQEAYVRLLPWLAGRQRRGFIRECHGDLHLRNMVDTESEVLIFDGIEFNPNLTWIDVLNEAAFLVMDLEHRDHRPLGWRFLNRYLELTGDYAGLVVFDYYLVYRALVRAKVEAFSGSREFRSYLALARRLALPRKPRLMLTRGVSGSGKTYQSQRILESEGWIRLRSDVERKRLFGLGPEQATGSGLGTGIYGREASQLTYARLLSLSRQILEAGDPVLVDATFLTREQREPFRQLACEQGVPFAILDLEVEPEVARNRLLLRRDDASEADLAVLERQLSRYAPLDSDELDDRCLRGGTLC